MQHTVRPDAPALREAQPVRRKSGLVRTAGGFDAFVFSLAGISVGIMFSWSTLYGTGFYPGANPYVALVISVAAALVIAWAYGYWGQIFPRTGGDYVFLSRGTHPGLALGVNFVYCWILMVSPAFAMSIMQPLVSSFTATIGLGGLADWFATDTGFAVIGTTTLLVASGVALFGLKPAIQYMKVLFLVGLAGQLILIVALLFSHTSTFVSHLEAQTGLTVAKIQSTAAGGGFAHGGFDLRQTLNLTNWFVTSLFFAALVVYIGGEVKNAAKNIRYAMLAAVGFSGLATAVWLLAYLSVVPAKLQGALAWNAFVSPEASTAQLPYPHELMAILWGTSGGGLILTLIAYVALLAWVTLWTPLVLSFTQRAVLAWSLDGLMPRWVGSVNERWHTPVPALIIAFLMGESFMLAFALEPSFRTIILLVPLFVGIGLTMLVGIFFPYVRKDLIRQSTIADAKLFGIHRMSLTCGAGFIIMTVWAYLMWNDATASGTDRTPIWVTIGIVVAIALYYVGLREVKRRRGEDITVTFKRIPVE